MGWASHVDNGARLLSACPAPRVGTGFHLPRLLPLGAASLSRLRALSRLVERRGGRCAPLSSRCEAGDWTIHNLSGLVEGPGGGRRFVSAVPFQGGRAALPARFHLGVPAEAVGASFIILDHGSPMALLWDGLRMSTVEHVSAPHFEGAFIFPPPLCGREYSRRFARSTVCVRLRILSGLVERLGGEMGDSRRAAS